MYVRVHRVSTDSPVRTGNPFGATSVPHLQRSTWYFHNSIIPHFPISFVTMPSQSTSCASSASSAPAPPTPAASSAPAPQGCGLGCESEHGHFPCNATGCGKPSHQQCVNDFLSTFGLNPELGKIFCSHACGFQLYPTLPAPFEDDPVEGDGANVPLISEMAETNSAQSKMKSAQIHFNDFLNYVDTVEACHVDDLTAEMVTKDLISRFASYLVVAFRKEKKSKKKNTKKVEEDAEAEDVEHGNPLSWNSANGYLSSIKGYLLHRFESEKRQLTFLKDACWTSLRAKMNTAIKARNKKRGVKSVYGHKPANLNDVETVSGIWCLLQSW